ncbi:MAG: sigma-70 family RNA polymerase sigma factor [Propionicimonas sp.]|uniref:RNA polymerase sigma factor n=1 Tax=Propionicimonas sp. TaxID=1955623 RepID=UPI003D13D18F
MQDQADARTGRASFELFVRARSDDLVGLAGLVTRNWADAQDAVQDALVALYPRWASLPDEPDLNRYVNRAVINASLKILRGRRRSMPLDDIEWVATSHHSPDPADAVVLARQAWALWVELPPVQRAALALRFHQDLNYAEIAQILGCAEATARSHVHRAVATLRTRHSEGEQP